MKTTNLTFAKAYRDRAFETTYTSLMIVNLGTEGYLITNRKEATRYEKNGYEIF